MILQKKSIKNECPFLPFPHLIHFSSFITSENRDGQCLQSQPSTWHHWWAQFERLDNYTLTTSSSFMTGNKPSTCMLCSFPAHIICRVIPDKLWEKSAIYANIWRLPGNVQPAMSQNTSFFELWKMYSCSQKSFRGDMGELPHLKSEAQTSEVTLSLRHLRKEKLSMLSSHLFSKEQGKFASFLLWKRVIQD